MNMWGPIAYAFSAASGYIAARAGQRFIEGRTVDVIEVGDRKVRIVEYWYLWPPSMKPRRFKVDELRAGLWLDTGIRGKTAASVGTEARAMLSPGPG
jgi:hypothetical protein